MNKLHKESYFILVVDDIPRNILILEKILKQEKYQVNTALTGEEALDIADRTLPDLILLDTAMPKMSGFDVCRRLKKSERTKDIPVIFLINKDEKNDVLKGFQLGAADYVAKPFNPVELLARVNTHLELRENKKTISQKSNEIKKLLHILCYDLANPIGAAVSYIDLIDNNMNCFKELRDDMIAALKNGMRTITLVKEMQSFEGDKFLLELETVNLKHTIEESLIRVKFKAENKQIKILTEIPENLDVVVDLGTFRDSVINNILNNAIKFSHKGSSIKIKAREEKGQILISVKDSGIGMSREVINNIFDTGTPERRDGTEGEIGTGYSMYLVKKIISAYGGEIEISSLSEKENSDNHGTEVIIKLKTKPPGAKAYI